MKTRELFLHFKQGDDFGYHLKHSGSTSEALRKWATSFARCRDICEQIARVLDDKKVSVTADTHYIAFAPEDAEADRALASLEKEKILTPSPAPEE